MASWEDLLNDFINQPDDQKGAWLMAHETGALAQIARLRGDRNVVLYASSFLQKPWAPADSLMIAHEDINGLMSVIYQMDFSKGLTLLLHTPGGQVTATESIVAYLRSKFPDIEVIVPTMAMSAGTMIREGFVQAVKRGELPVDPSRSITTRGR